MIKIAEELLDDLKGWANANEGAIRNSVIAGGVGGAAGGLMTSQRNGESDEDYRKRKLKNALVTAGLGTGAAGAIQYGINQLDRDIPIDPNAPTARREAVELVKNTISSATKGAWDNVVVPTAVAVGEYAPFGLKGIVPVGAGVVGGTLWGIHSQGKLRQAAIGDVAEHVQSIMEGNRTDKLNKALVRVQSNLRDAKLDSDAFTKAKKLVDAAGKDAVTHNKTIDSARKALDAAKKNFGRRSQDTLQAAWALRTARNGARRHASDVANAEALIKSMDIGKINKNIDKLELGISTIGSQLKDIKPRSIDSIKRALGRGDLDYDIVRKAVKEMSGPIGTTRQVNKVMSNLGMTRKVGGLLRHLARNKRVYRNLSLGGLAGTGLAVGANYLGKYIDQKK